MLGTEILRRIDARGASETQKAGMLAGTVVVQRRRPAGARRRGGGVLRDRPMGAAAQRRRRKPGFRQHALDAGDMPGFPAMRGASERKLPVGKSEAVGRPLFYERQGLQRLDGRARKHRRGDVAGGKHGAALGVDHRDGAAMPALDQRTADDFDENRIAHAPCAELPRRLPR